MVLTCQLHCLTVNIVNEDGIMFWSYSDQILELFRVTRIVIKTIKSDPNIFISCHFIP